MSDEQKLHLIEAHFYAMLNAPTEIPVWFVDEFDEPEPSRPTENDLPECVRECYYAVCDEIKHRYNFINYSFQDVAAKLSKSPFPHEFVGIDRASVDRLAVEIRQVTGDYHNAMREWCNRRDRHRYFAWRKYYANQIINLLSED